MLRIEVTIDKLNAKSFPVGYTNALTEELTNRLNRKFGEVDVKVRFAGADGLTVLGGASEDEIRSRIFCKRRGKALMIGFSLKLPVMNADNKLDGHDE
ncbi:DinI family protein [Yersinia pekkanenii]|uniref:DinI family protein n=1 Tax=Yersinia pekkanenii TaxID=1288385 RepID=A0ABP2A457_9GAMM|nr:DinI family protein [Yersinia pekkanenii]